MIVMPAGSTGWFWHALARETGRIGHLYSPGDQRGPWPWFPYALDNGSFACWDMDSNTFDATKWASKEIAWRHLLVWSSCRDQRPLWAVVPDVVGNAAKTIEQWPKYAPTVQQFHIPLAVAVQDGMTPDDVRSLSPAPDVVAVGGSTDWKWETAESWVREFPRVHVLRCNNVDKVEWLESIGAESCDGTGWNRGDRSIRTAGLEKWARRKAVPHNQELWPFACRSTCKRQLVFA